MWADLDPSSGGEVYYQGDASSFVAAYEAVAYCCGTDTPNNTFQATFTPAGAILLAYKDLQEGGSQQPSIGYENGDGALGKQISYGWDAAPADESAINIVPP